MILDVWNSYICSAVKKGNEEILTVKNTTELEVENRTWKNFFGLYGIWTQFFTGPIFNY